MGDSLLTRADPLLELLFEEPGAGRCLVAPDGSVLRANAEWLRASGLDLDEALGADVLSLFPDVRDMTLALHARARAGHRVVVPLHARRVLGRETWWEGAIDPVPMEGGTGLLLTSREVPRDAPAAERPAAEPALDLDRLQELFHPMPVGVLAVEASSGRLLFENPEMQRLLSRAGPAWRTERTGLLHACRPGGGPIADEEQLLWRALRGGQTASEVLEIVCEDGSRVLAEVYGSPVRGPGGAVVAALVVARDLSEHQRTELALREALERLRVAKESARIGIYDHDLVAGTIHWDERMNELWGLDPVDPVTPERFLEGLHPDDREPTRAAIARALDPAHGGWASVEYRVVNRRTGAERWLAATGRVCFAAGRPVRMIGSAIDITERKRVEASLREQLAVKEQFVKVAAAVPGVICSFRLRPDGTSCMPFATAAIEDLYGFSREQLAQDMGPCFALTDPADQARTQASIAEAARTLSGWHDAFRYRHPVKGLRWIEGWSLPIAEPDGSTLWHGFLMDVTERKRAEEALQESERRAKAHAAELQVVLDTVPAAVWIARDPEGRRIDTNRAGAELLRLAHGTSVAAGAGLGGPPQGLRFLKDGRELSPGELPLLVAMRFGTQLRDCQLDVALGDGTTRRLLGHSAPLADAGGGQPGAVGAFVDITAHKQAEEALRAANLQLAESDRHKDEFLAVLSHELRNPLAPINNSLRLLERVAAGSPQAEHAREVLRRQTAHLNRLVDDLLDVTRISRGKITLHRERCDLREIARRTCDDHATVFERADVALSLVLTPEPLWVDADVTRVAQALGNLLQNAVKFSPPGTTVRVTAEARAGWAVLRVRDQGIGMALDLVERVFDPFVQADRDLARTKGGLGLGLALVKGFVEIQGGRVAARSEGVGHGSEFSLELRLASPPRTAAPAPGAAPAAASRLVLLVEDNVDAGRTLAELLELDGHRVHIACDGRSGIAAARELRPDVVLCDIGLPDVDGYEVARTLRGDASLRGTRLIALSGYALPEDRERSADAGFEAHLAKPPELDELAALLAGPAPRPRRKA